MLKRLLEWDRDTFVYLNNLGIEEFDFFWATVTNIVTWIPLFIFIFILFFLKFSKREALFKIFTVLALLLFVILLTYITKNYVARLRPNNVPELHTLIRILKSPTGYSFFSGHASSSFAITTLMVLFLKKKTRGVWFFFLWPLLFSFSRIYVGVHFPIDILVGALVGVLSAVLFYFLYNKFITPYLASVRP